MSLKENSTDEPIRLLFFGTFFHENTDLTADLIQLKQPVQITEIRVIPLGATVDLSTGAFQLGATNPSEFDVEFYYNDLQVPSKTTFELLRRFDFNDKTRIQLVCEAAEKIITDGLLVRGIYSTVTLAVYGHTVDEVPIKEVEPEKKESPASKVVADLVTIDSPAPPESPEKVIQPDVVEEEIVEAQAKIIIPLEAKDSPPPVPPTVVQAIPIITTRVNYDAVQASLEEAEGTEEPMQVDVVVDPEESEISNVSPATAASDTFPSAVPVPEVMDTEDISSDGEVFPSDDEDVSQIQDEDKDAKSLDKEPTTEVVPKPYIDPLIELIEPISSPPQDQLSDVDDSLVDEFQEPGFEEIISDEEIDFPEYDYGEWEENWAHKFSRTFNPFSESFQVLPLKNIVSNYETPVHKSNDECWDMLVNKCKRFSPEQFNPNLSEIWVEEMEKLLPFIAHAMDSRQRTCNTADVESTLFFWVQLGLDFPLAMEQPSLAFKTRHLKVGIRLVQCLANIGGNIADGLVRLVITTTTTTTTEDGESEESSCALQHCLLDLLTKPHMSNANKLLILRTLDATVSTKLGFVYFTSPPQLTEKTCYQRLLEFFLDSSFSSRMTFSLRSLSNKLKLMDGLFQLEDLLAELTDNLPKLSSDSTALQVLEDLVATATHVDQYFAHPLRLLPAKAVLDLPPMSSTGHDPTLSFVRMLKETKFVQMAAVLINLKDNEIVAKAISPITELLSTILKWESGLVFLCNEASATMVLIKSLLQQDDDSTSVGCLIAHCMELMQCVDILSNEQPLVTETEEGNYEDLHHLQVAVSFLTTSVGRDALVNTLSKGKLIAPFVKCVRAAETDERYRQMSPLEKTARRGYAIEILEFIVRSSDSVEFIEKNGPSICNLISSLADSPDSCEKLNHIQPFLKPSLNHIIFTLEGVEALCNLAKAKQLELLQSRRTVENNWGFPAELTTVFRILCELVTGSEDNDISRNLLVNTDELLVRQLKHDLALAKIHSSEMVSTMIAILQKISVEFAQPTIHSHVFVSSRGDAMLALILPLMKVLRKTISQVIQVRKADFRDTTAVPALLKIFGLMDFFPSHALSYLKAQEVSQHVVGILLSYTVPSIKHGSEAEDELNKSTWSVVISEIIKFTLDEPANFQSGLTLLSEMLPLPLPIASKSDLSEATCGEAIKLRRLWSAYIHGLSSQLQEMIGMLCASTNVRLLNLLKRVCVQLADLSVSTCLVVCRAVLDAYLLASESDNEAAAPDLLVAAQANPVKAWVDNAKTLEENQCSPHAARLLAFVSSLVSNCAAIKCGIMHIMKGSTKIDEKYCDFLNSMCSILLVQSNNLTNCHIQAQDSVVTIFQSLCDVEINMLTPMFGKPKKSFDAEFFLANSLPQKEHLTSITSTLILYLKSFDVKSPVIQVLEGVLRSLEIIAETEHGLANLLAQCEKHPGLLLKTAFSLISSDLKNPEIFESMIPFIMSYFDFLKSITTSRPQAMGSFPPRCNIFQRADFKQLWAVEQQKDNLESVDNTTASEAQNKAADHLFQLKEAFETHLELVSKNDVVFNNIEGTDLESAMQIISQLLQYLSEAGEFAVEDIKANNEVKFPVAETLTELFNARPVYVLVDRVGNDNLPIFWLTSVPPAFEVDTYNEESDLVVCDLEEISKTYLSGYDVVKEIQMISKASDVQNNTQIDANSDPSYKDDGHMRRPPPLSLVPFHRRPHFGNSMRGGHGRGMFSRGLGQRNMYDPFRSRPPNTSRPPSLHVDDFVAMESGQSGGPAQLRSGSGNESFNNRGRPGSRGGGGGFLNYPQDRRRPGAVLGARPAQPVNYYPDKRHESPSLQARSVRGGRIYSTPNSDRWTADTRNNGSPAGYERSNRPSSSGNYDDKYRSSPGGGPTRSTNSSPRTHNNSSQPYPPRSTAGYNRDARSSAGNYTARWKERQNNKPFNR